MTTYQTLRSTTVTRMDDPPEAEPARTAGFRYRDPARPRGRPRNPVSESPSITPIRSEPPHTCFEITEEQGEWVTVRGLVPKTFAEVLICMIDGIPCPGY